MFDIVFFQHFFFCHRAPLPMFCSFQGSCYVKMTKNYYKSIFLLCVCPNNEWKLFIYFFGMKYVWTSNCFTFPCVMIWVEFFILFIWYDVLFDDIITPFTGPICVKITRNGAISTFIAPFDILSSKHCRETPALLACFFISNRVA